MGGGGGGLLVFCWPHHRPGPPHRHGPPSLIISPLRLYIHVLPTAAEWIPIPPHDVEVSIELFIIKPLSLELFIIKPLYHKSSLSLNLYH